MDTQHSQRQVLWRVVVRTVVSTAVLAGLAFVLLVALLLMALRCENGCPDDYRGDLLYDGQFWVACGTSLLGLVAVFLGYVPGSRAYRWTAVGAGVGLVVWFVLIAGRT
jgi:hypothetical protein